MFMSDADLGKCRSWIWTDQSYFHVEMLISIAHPVYNRNYRVAKDEGTMLRTRMEEITGFNVVVLVSQPGSFLKPTGRNTIAEAQP